MPVVTRCSHRPLRDYARLGREIDDLQAIRDARKAEIPLGHRRRREGARRRIHDQHRHGRRPPGTLVTAEMVGTYIGGRRGFRNFRVTSKK